jgi:hypothetical protein
MKGQSPQGSRGVPYLSGKVKADNYFSNTVGENSQDLTGRLNVVKFSILLQRDTIWKNLCERWTNGYGQKYQGGMITKADKENRFTTNYGLKNTDKMVECGQNRQKAYAVYYTEKIRNSRIPDAWEN